MFWTLSIVAAIGFGGGFLLNRWLGSSALPIIFLYTAAKLLYQAFRIRAQGSESRVVDLLLEVFGSIMSLGGAWAASA